MFGYATTIRSLTQGRGIFTMEFDKYEQVPSNVAEEIISGKNKNKKCPVIQLQCVFLFLQVVLKGLKNNNKDLFY